MFKRILSAAAVLLMFCLPATAWDISTMGGESPWIFTPAGEKVLKVNPFGDRNVAVQDQTTPSFSVKASLNTNVTTMAVAAVVDDTSITVASDVGINVGDYIGLFNLVTDRFYVGTVLTKPGANILTLDTPIDSTFEIGDTVGTGITNMAVDGSVTPQIFTLRGPDPGIELTGDITRMIITCEAADPVSLAKFCGETALTKGIVIRRMDGFYQNLFNWKTDFDIAGSMYDYTPLLASAPAQSVDGFISRLTWGGMSKIGVVIRVAPGDDVEVIIQDLLTGITRLEITFQGHIVE